MAGLGASLHVWLTSILSTEHVGQCQLSYEPAHDLRYPWLGNAVLTPSFLSCIQPFWLWTDWNDEDISEENGRIAGEEPGTHEDRELKRVFEEAAGPEYMRFAYSTPYRLARTLLVYAIQPFPFRSNEGYEASLVMIEEWVEFMKGRGKTSKLKPFPSKNGK